MRSVSSLRRGVGPLLASAAVTAVVAMGTGAAAQESPTPDFSSGWELRVDEPMPLGTVVAGSDGVGFVARNFDGDVFWSGDGLEWTRTTDPTGNLAVRDLAANDRGFVAPLEAAPVTEVLFSPDGLAWETVDVGTPSGFYVRAFGGPEGFLVVGQHQCEVQARFSADGREWTPAELPVGCSNLLAAPTDDGWIALARIDARRAVVTSTDGMNWVDLGAETVPTRVPPLARFSSGLHEIVGLASLTADLPTLVFVGSQTEGMWVSVDSGTNWTETDVDPGQIEMAVSDLGFVGVAGNRVLHSADGTTWNEFSAEVSFHDVAAIGNTIVALSPDGIYTWTAGPGSLAFTGTDLAFLISIGALLLLTGAAALTFRRGLAGPAPQ